MTRAVARPLAVDDSVLMGPTMLPLNHFTRCIPRCGCAVVQTDACDADRPSAI
jgi:hypothetical protein